MYDTYHSSVRGFQSMGEDITTVELAVESLPNQSTIFNPFYLDHGHESIIPIQLQKKKKNTRIESVQSFVHRVTSDLEVAEKIYKKR